MGTRRKRQTNPLLAVAYLRVSTDEQSLGSDAQLAAIHRWCKLNGITIAAVHEDSGVSGGLALEHRHGLLAAIEGLSQLGAGVLVLAKRDRLARDPVVAAMAERLAERCGARVASAAGEGTEGGDDPAAVLMRRMVDVFAEYERLVIKARTKAALGVKRARGELTGSAPFGWQRAADGVHLDANPREQAVIARARALRAGGLSMRAVAAGLAVEGREGRTGRPLNLTQVARMLRSSPAR